MTATATASAVFLRLTKAKREVVKLRSREIAEQ